MRRLALLPLGLLACTTLRPMETRPGVARLFSGEVGWYQVRPGLELDAADRPLLPAVTPQVLADNPSVKLLLMRTYAAQFTALPPGAPCPGERAAGGAGPVFIFVHGIGGDELEWVPVVPTLGRLAPEAMYMYRWFFPRARGELIEELVSGVERIAACHQGAPLVLLAHSAGGVLASFAASRFRLPSGAGLVVLTVASPLAGAGSSERFDIADDEYRFLLHLGGVIRTYAPPAPGVRVRHLRTSWPADTAMKPSASGYRPNDPAVRVEGAEVVDLPPTLDHSACLQHVARELLARGR